ARIRGLETPCAELGREIADNRIGFPKDEAIFFERWHEPIGIHCEIGGLPILAGRSAHIDALVRQGELADEPHHLLHIDRSRASPNPDHARPPESLPPDQSSRRASSGSMIGMPPRMG